MSKWIDFWYACLTELDAPAGPYMIEDDREITLHFEISSVQSQMCKTHPNKLILGYTNTMMGFLLFQPEPKRIAMIGLGGGSLAKYCLQHLPEADFTAVEINPDVIALRDKFIIPPDGPNFKVLCEDGAVYVQNRSELVDVLLVDGFDQGGQVKQLCSKTFYSDCYAKLQDGGVMAVNLLHSDPRFGTYTARIREAFNDQVVFVEAEEFGNNIAFAYKGENFPLEASVSERARVLGQAHTVALHKIAQKVNKQFREGSSTVGSHPLPDLIKSIF